MKLMKMCLALFLTIGTWGISPSGIMAQDVTPDITVADQSASGRQVTIPQTVMAQDGWVVIHNSDADGNIVLPDIISEPMAVSAGTTDNVVVTLTQDPTEGQKLFAMLHIDAETMGTYEFPGPDAPVKVDDKVVVKPFVVSVPPTTMPVTGGDAGSSLPWLIGGVVLALLGGLWFRRRNGLVQA